MLYFYGGVLGLYFINFATYYKKFTKGEVMGYNVRYVVYGWGESPKSKQK